MSIKKSQGENICQVSSVAQGVLGAVGGLSKAHHLKLKMAFPGGPQHVGVSGPSVTIDGEIGQLASDDPSDTYGATYQKAVMRGPSSTAAFGKTIDMSYGTSEGTEAKNVPPNLNLLPSVQIDKEGTEFETAQGSPAGSTISLSGMGPNTNVHPQDDIKTRRMSDVHPGPATVSSPIDTTTSLVGSTLPPLPGESDSEDDGPVL